MFHLKKPYLTIVFVFPVTFLFRTKELRTDGISVLIPSLTETSELRHIILRINQTDPQNNLIQVFVDCRPQGTVAVPYSFRDFGQLEATAVSTTASTFPSTLQLVYPFFHLQRKDSQMSISVLQNTNAEHVLRSVGCILIERPPETIRRPAVRAAPPTRAPLSVPPTQMWMAYSNRSKFFSLALF